MSACPTGKYHSAYSPHALIELNLALTQYILAQHVQKFKILSFYPGYDAMSEKTISRYCPFMVVMGFILLASIIRKGLGFSFSV